MKERENEREKEKQKEKEEKKQKKRKKKEKKKRGRRKEEEEEALPCESACAQPDTRAVKELTKNRTKRKEFLGNEIVTLQGTSGLWVNVSQQQEVMDVVWREENRKWQRNLHFN
ncbi:hypothetical protein H920_08088 [Fukomys damarensis]|uniref:Uncharacterized protein n=1 Tax=Fukomys damarensis TaxID=885580 RepID=A0A091E5W7_FUKDA|nr:hypothetical protein H920_08088 [Fukomys damarensis]